MRCVGRQMVEKITMNVLRRNSFTEDVGLEGFCSRTQSRGVRVVFTEKKIGMEWGHCIILDGKVK